MKTNKKLATGVRLSTAVLALGLAAGTALADTYQIDTKGMHASIVFKVKHLGFSWLTGRFNKFDGTFEYDPAHPEKSSVQVHIDVTSLDTNHAERDKHLRSARYFDTEKFPDASFKSKEVKMLFNGKALIKGDFTLRGVTRPVEIEAELVGKGNDPWGGYRAGFTGKTTLHLSDYHMKEAAMLGPASEDIEVLLNIEGVKQ